MSSTEANTQQLYIGIMSGTSLDGLDAVLVDLSATPRALHHAHLDYPAEFRASLRHLCEAKQVELETLMTVDAQLAELSAHCVQELLSRAELQASHITAIGSHGQTVRHVPPPREGDTADAGRGWTLQIGDPNTIAALTGITVVADFRRANLARGGHGAPLAPAFHTAAFSAEQTRVVVNIGGMANISLLAAHQPTVGFDTGPGNVLMNSWIARHQQQPHDTDGQWAASGQVSEALLSRLLAHPFFAQAIPKSTGREDFNQQWLDSQLSGFEKLPIEDVQATLLELTARSICDALQEQSLSAVYVCGGGAHNKQLLHRLGRLLSPTPVSTTADLGIAPDLVECCAFAWFAQQTMQHQPIAIASFTGGKADSVLGGIYWA